jgi:Ribose 5-phosphate isomerase A (phosphoriboisomerase A)
MQPHRIIPTLDVAEAGHLGADRDALKRAAADAAAELVRDGMVVGLGTGSTAAFALDALARRYRQGSRFVGIPTSEQTAARATALGIPLSSFTPHRQIDLTIDGADEVERGTLNLIKGLGGALLHEKIVASNSRRLAIIVDEAKLVDRLGMRACRKGQGQHFHARSRDGFERGVRFAHDSPLEGDGFELSVPGRETVKS